jgi:hypothetical protein
MWFNPDRDIERLTAEFQEGKAQIWADPDMPLQDKGPAVEQLWREFNRQRQEIRSSASQGEATGEEHPSPQRSRAPFLPRRRMPRWK